MLYRYYILYTLYRYRLQSYTEGYGVDINISVCYTDITYSMYTLYRYRLQSYTEGYGVDINISVCYTDITYCILYIGID
jgi:F420-0:gamma-glutamyl ligase-like protein